MEKMFLMLPDGTVFEGKSFGAKKDAVGELVFTTQMSKDIETLSDPSFFSQIVLNTFPLIGNYGFIPQDIESGRSKVGGYVVREICMEPSNFRCVNKLSDYLIDQDIPALCDVDTRAVSKHIIKTGAQNAILTTLCPKENRDFLMDKLLSHKPASSVAAVSIKDIAFHTPHQNPILTVAVLDLGVLNSTINALIEQGLNVIVFPHNSTAAQILSHKPNGVLISGGPGNPADNAPIAEEIKNLLAAGIPMFGIGLGHQLMAIACGGQTKKLHLGHRGANHVVKETETGRVYNTYQNHGYAVVSESLPKECEISFTNLTDQSCEGISYKNFSAFSVQFYPATIKTMSIGRLYERFISMMKGSAYNAH